MKIYRLFKNVRMGVLVNHTGLRWSSTSRPRPRISAVAPTGLFGWDKLRNPEDLIRACDKAIEEAMQLIEVILKDTNAPSDPSMLDASARTAESWTVKRLDRLSDAVCSVVDTAELLRNVHPDEKFVEAAHAVHERLSDFLSWLNVHQELYQVSSVVVLIGTTSPVFIYLYMPLYL
jgi:mitochondrial intermediate peptidase